MKIGDATPPSNEPDLNTENADSQKCSEDDAPSAFSRMLAKKRGSDQDTGPLKGGKGASSNADEMGAMFSQTGKVFEASIQVAPVESKQAVALPVDLQQLVREISVGVNKAGNQQVNIEMNSSVLKGLHVSIERREGAVAIHFQSTSDQVTGLLSRNLESLSQVLGDRGVSVADIQVSGPRESARAREQKGQSNSGGRGQGGRQGGGR